MSDDKLRELFDQTRKDPDWGIGDEYPEDWDRHPVFVTDDGIVPTCDLCGGPQRTEGDLWNGETGNHYACESETTSTNGELIGRGPKMRYRVSQGEFWHRVYCIEAVSPEDALRLYKSAPDPDAAFECDDPEYIEDLDDIEVYDELGA